MPECKQTIHCGENAIVVPAKREAFDSLRTWVETYCRQLGCTDKARNHLLIACDEIFTNIASYAYQNTDGDVRIEASFNPASRAVTVSFIDSGIAYNPLNASPPDINKPLADRAIGGLGVFVVKKLMDSVDYKYADGKNVFSIHKVIS